MKKLKSFNLTSFLTVSATLFFGAYFSSDASAQRTFTANGVEFTMISVEGGSFDMGATREQKDADRDENPVHSVTLSSYYIGKTEVTQALWEAVMGENPSRFKGAELPVEQVSWEDCQIFIEKLNALTGENFRLPTEAEWEYAARGGKNSKGYRYSGSDKLDKVAWYTKNSGDKTHAVATKQANELGVHDMSGNVWEWCADKYGLYAKTSQTDPKGAASGACRVGRGCCWGGSAGLCRVAFRGSGKPDFRNQFLGLRLAL